MITIIHGPPGSGKTRNASYLKGKFASKRIVDDYPYNSVPIKDNDLILTSLKPPYEFDYPHQIFSIGEALTK